MQDVGAQGAGNLKLWEKKKTLRLLLGMGNKLMMLTESSPILDNTCLIVCLISDDFRGKSNQELSVLTILLFLL